jgi:tetratricopeptide (TPR) repeat protein
MAGSEAFRGSPQLVAFLRYVVEATLRGTADRIKGYTIAVEALGRDENFDPQADPIVRVEAMRLRRALARYYENGGKHDPILIDLPLGSYVPAFRRNPLAGAAPQEPPRGETDAPVPPAAVPEHAIAAPSPPVATSHDARLPAAAPADPPSTTQVPERRGWRGAASRPLARIAAAAALVIGGGAIVAGLDFWLGFNGPSTRTALEMSQSRASELARPPSIFPVVYVGAFQAEGDAPLRAAAAQLRDKLRDALARFEEVTVVRSPPPDSERRASLPSEGRSGRYDLSASIEAGPGGTINFAVRLSDVSDDRIVFARTFSQALGATGPGTVDDTIVREIAVALAQPYGVIQSRERSAQMAGTSGDPRYRCLIEAYEYWRGYTPALHARARECLERVTEADPSFAAGFAALTEIVLQEHRRDLNPRPSDASPLERGLRYARRAVELRPDSARAYQALMDAHFVRGEATLALEAGKKAVTLNPYNPVVLATYGARLVALGEVEKGQGYLREAALAGAVRPGWHEFFLFLAAYLLDDRRAAATHAAQIVSDKFPLGYLARTLVAVQSGRLDLARTCFAKLVALQPGWRDDPLAQARKSFPAETVALRVTQDLAQAAVSYGQ